MRSHRNRDGLLRGGAAVLPVALTCMWMPSTVESDEVKTNEVRCAEIAFSLALETRDQAAFASMIDPDARFVSGRSQVLQGRDRVVEAWSGLFEEERNLLVWRPMVVEVLASGDLALSRGPYRLTGKGEDGEDFEAWGFYNSTWRLNPEGRWQVVFDAGSPSSQPPTDEMRELLEQPVEGCG